MVMSREDFTEPQAHWWGVLKQGLGYPEEWIFENIFDQIESNDSIMCDTRGSFMTRVFPTSDAIIGSKDDECDIINNKAIRLDND